MTNILASLPGKKIIDFKRTYVLSDIQIAWEDMETPKKLTLQVAGVEKGSKKDLYWRDYIKIWICCSSTTKLSETKVPTFLSSKLWNGERGLESWDSQETNRKHWGHSKCSRGENKRKHGWVQWRIASWRIGRSWRRGKWWKLFLHFRISYWWSS